VYGYDAAHNLTSETRYHDLAQSASYTISYDYGSYSPQPVEKRVEGVLASDGQAAKNMTDTGQWPNGPGVYKEAYAYYDNGLLQWKKDGCNLTTTYEYDGLSRLTKQTHADGSTQTAAYNDTQNTRLIKDENGFYTLAQYTPLGDLAKVYAGESTAAPILLSYEYDSLRRKTSESVWDGTTVKQTTAYEYDYLNRVTHSVTTDSASTVLRDEETEYDDACQSQYQKVSKWVIGDGSAADVYTATLTDKFNRTVKTLFGDENTPYANEYAYDSADNRVCFLSAKDRLENPLGAFPTLYTTRQTYDYAGRLLKTTDAPDPALFTQNTYDALGRKTAHMDKANSAKVQDPLQTHFEYDSLDRLLRQETPLDIQGSTVRYAQTRYDYDAAGSLICQRTYDPEQPTGYGEWKRTDYLYDNRRRLAYVSAAELGRTVWTQYAYDAAGNQAAVYAGMPSMAGQASAHVTQYLGYNRFGKPESILYPLNGAEAFNYDNTGLLVQKTERDGRVIEYGYDALNRPLWQKTARTGGGFHVLETAYTKTGEKASAKSYDLLPNEQVINLEVIAYEYDNRGLLCLQSEDSVQKQYEYDANANRTRFNLNIGTRAALPLYWEYDGLNRLTALYRGAKTPNGLLAQYTYDANSNRSTLAQGPATVAYVYNEANLVTAITTQTPQKTETFSYAYYQDGNVKQKTQYGKTTLYHYDAQGRLISEETANGTISYTYDTHSNRLQKTEGDTTTLYDYDGDNRLVKKTTTSQDRIETYGYRYDPCGRQTRRERYVLKKVKNPALPAGSMGLARGFVPGGEPPMLETREYDAWGRVTLIVRDGTVTAYTLRPDGLRDEKTVSRYGAPDQTTRYRWDGEDMAATEENGTTTHYLRGADLAASETEGRLLYYLHDAHGDVTEVVDASGNSLKSYDYDAFGNEQDPDAEDTNPFRYCGEYWDIHTNALYLRARDYKPRIGRFLSQDTHWNTGNRIYGDEPVKWNEQQSGKNYPLELNTFTYFPDNTAIMQSGNLYVYGMNNPIRYTDPNGRSTTAIGIETSAAFLFYFGLTVQIASDSKGNIGLVIAGLVGGGTPSASIVGAYTETRAESIFDLEGIGFSSGGSHGFGMDSISGKARDGSYVSGIQVVGFGLSAPLPEGHGTITISKVISLNWIPNYAKIFIKKDKSLVYRNQFLYPNLGHQLEVE
jgi:RHS repeat-associated protein